MSKSFMKMAENLGDIMDFDKVAILILENDLYDLFLDLEMSKG